MTRQQKLGACFGGVFGVIVLALGWFLYSAYADHQAALDGDEEAQTKGLNAAKVDNQNYYTQSKPFPSDRAIKAVNSNKTAYVEWKERAVDVSSHGDIPDMPSGLNGDSFKVNYLDVYLKKLQLLPGRVNGHICAETVWFGFEKYMPPVNEAPKNEDTPKLYKQFVIVTNVVQMLQGQCDVLEIQKIVPLDKEENEEETQNAKQRGRARKGGNDKNATPANTPTCYDYELVFKARASVLVKVLNALAKSPRFYVVKEFGFEYEGESLRERLDRSDASGAGDSSSPRSRRRGREEEKKSELSGGDVINPAQEFLVTMKLSVYDFGKGATSKKEGE